jgi:nickel transport protein
MRLRHAFTAALMAVLLLLTADAGRTQGGPAPPTPQPAMGIENPTGGAPSPAAATPLPADMEKAIEKALDRKLAPILRTLAEMQEQKIRLTDVLGGLGYILGLVGVAAYYGSRRKRDTT